MQADLILQPITLANRKSIPKNGFNYSDFTFPLLWNAYFMHELFDIKGGRPISRNDMGTVGTACIHYGDIHTSPKTVFDIQQLYERISKVPNSHINDDDLLHDGDIVFADASEDYEGIGKSIVVDNPNNLRVIGGLHTVIASDKTKLINKAFKKYMFSNWLFRKQIMFFSQGISVYGISKANIENLLISIPPIEDQKNIASILSTWDNALELLYEYIKLEILKKKALVSRIYRGSFSKSIRTDSFEYLKNHILEVGLRNGTSHKSVLSVSNSKGFIPQQDQFDREIASSDKCNYKIVKRGDFAYNPSRVNVGSIDMLTKFDHGLLSPMYIVFTCKPSLDKRYLYHFIKSDLFLRMIPNYTQGSVRDSLSFSGLSAMKIFLPSLIEQLRFSTMLDAIDKKIDTLQMLVRQYEAQKKGLMQQLLTGKLRVKL